MTKMGKYEYIGFFAICITSLIFSLLVTDNMNYGILNYFLPMNTSLWEMGKLMFTSILIYSIFGYFIYGKEYTSYWFAKASSMLIGPLVFIGLSYLADINIGVYTATHLIVFALAVGMAQYTSYIFMDRKLHFKLMSTYGIIAIITMLTVFSVYNEKRGTVYGSIYKPNNQYKRELKMM